jgi:hypothetical protein
MTSQLLRLGASSIFFFIIFKVQRKSSSEFHYYVDMRILSTNILQSVALCVKRFLTDQRESLTTHVTTRIQSLGAQRRDGQSQRRAAG